MHYELQKASMPKRIAALLIDLILVAILATGGAWLLSDLLNYDDYANTVQQAIAQNVEAVTGAKVVSVDVNVCGIVR